MACPTWLRRGGGRRYVLLRSPGGADGSLAAFSAATDCIAIRSLDGLAHEVADHPEGSEHVFDLRVWQLVRQPLPPFRGTGVTRNSGHGP